SGRDRAARALRARARVARAAAADRRGGRGRGGCRSMSKETGFYPRLQAVTDEWMGLFGYLAPLVVTDVLGEYRAVRESAGLMDFSMLRKVDIDGPGAPELVNSIVTRDVSKLTRGKIA